jgi:hypothetical protein
MTAKTTPRWRGLSSTVTARYLSRRTGRSQNGVARGSSEPFPPAGAEPPAGSAGGGAGLRPAAGRCRGPAPVLAPNQPAAGLSGQDRVFGSGWRAPGPPFVPLVPLVPLVLLVLLAGGADHELGAPDVARDRDGAGPAAVARPAPRDQLEAALAGPLPAAALVPVLGGRSSGGGVRAPLSVSGMFLLRARLPGLAPAPRREPELISPSPSAAGGASGRNRDA